MSKEINRLPNDHGQKNQKKLYLEVLRYIAIFFVIYNHTAENGFLLFMDNNRPRWAYFIYLFISQIDKMAVPIFFMI